MKGYKWKTKRGKCVANGQKFILYLFFYTLLYLQNPDVHCRAGNSLITFFAAWKIFFYKLSHARHLSFHFLFSFLMFICLYIFACSVLFCGAYFLQYSLSCISLYQCFPTLAISHIGGRFQLLGGRWACELKMVDDWMFWWAI